MKKYKLIKKEQYNNHGPLVLREYQIYQSENEKTLILSFLNDFSDELLNATVDIVQYDASKNIISKELYTFEELNIKAKTKFALNKRLNLNETCDSISINVINLDYTTNKYTEGVWLNEITEEEESLDNVVTFNQKNLRMKKYIYPFVIPVLIMALVIIFTSTNVFKKFNNEGFDESGFLYEEVYDGTLRVVKYVGKDFNITIPAFINERRVSEIGSYAFEFSYVRSIVIEADNIKIGTDAFSHAFFLKEVHGRNVTNLGDYAFSNTKRLKKVSFFRIDKFGYEVTFNSKIKDKNFTYHNKGK